MNRLRVAVRPALTIADQALSSGSNFVITVAAARMLGPADFGPFAIAFSVSIAVLALTRAFVGEPLLATGPGMRLRDQGMSAALMLGTSVGLPVGVVGLIGPWEATSALLWVAALAPFLSLQDAVRYAAFSDRKPATALVSDLAWLVSQVVVLAAASMLELPNHAVYIAWLAGPAVGAVVGCRWIGYTPFGREVRPWLAATRSLGPWLVAATAISQITGQALIFSIAAITSAEAFGGLRAMQTTVMPVALLLVAGNALAVPEIRRRLHDQRLERLLARCVGWLLALTALAALVAYVLSEPVARTLYGPDFVRYHRMIVAFAVLVGLQAVAVPAGAILRAGHHGREVFRAQLAASVVGVPFTLWLTTAHGVQGSAWGLAAQSVVASALTVGFARSAAKTSAAASSQDRLIEVR